MADEKGPDDHVVCVPFARPGLEHARGRRRPAAASFAPRSRHFFTVYKDLDTDRHSEVKGWAGREAALEAIEAARRAFLEAEG